MQILGGADLFLQGVLSPPGGLGDWLAGTARTVLVPGNPVPFAVGRMAVSKTEATRDGMKGRGLNVLHHYPGAPACARACARACGDAGLTLCASSK